jgi:hypothetical protein
LGLRTCARGERRCGEGDERDQTQEESHDHSPLPELKPRAYAKRSSAGPSGPAA